ncbi:apoptotic protease-activating factor 1-like [Branchiostoma floridae x Branchiostoma belcheri]
MEKARYDSVLPCSRPPVCQRPADDNPDYLYDILLSYCDRNRPWVLYTLASELERDNNLVLCLRDRDYESAKPRLQNFVDSARISARIVVVLSAAYLADGPCQKELDHAIASGRTMVAVRFDGCEIPAQFREGAGGVVLDRSDVDFWDKLHRFLHREQLDSSTSYTGACCDKKGRNTSFPVMPGVVVERPHDVDAVVVLVQITMETLKGRTNGRREGHVVGVVGEPGAGKTVLAQHVSRKLMELNKKVFWMTLGARPDVLQHLTRLTTAMTGRQLFFPELSDVVNFLTSFTADKDYVVVLDDVQDVADVTDVVCCLAGDCVTLLTCRNQEVLAKLHVPPANVHVLGGLPGPAAELLLLRSAGLHGELKQGDPRAEAVAAIAQECNYLPAATALVGSSVWNPKDPEWWKGTARDLKETENDPYTSKILGKALNVSYDSLRGETVRHCLIDCCVFLPERDIPLTTLVVFWKYRRNVSESSARGALYQLHSRSFVQRGGKHSSYRFHASVLSYVRAKLKEPESQLHRDLLESCREVGGGTWAECLQDGYYFQNAAHHFVRAGWTSTLVNLLTSYRWLKARLAHTDVTSLLSDFKDLKALTPFSSPIQEVLDTIRLSGQVLAKDKSQFEGQFLGRLSESSHPRIQKLVHEMRQEPRSDAALYPSSACLRRPGGCLVRSYCGHTDRVLCVAVTNFPDRRRVFTGCRDFTVRAWELGSGRDLGVLRGHRGQVCALHLRKDDRLLASASCDCTIKLWDTNRLELSATLTGHETRITGVAFTLDGRGLVSCSHDGVLKVWEDTVQIPSVSKLSLHKTPTRTRSLSSYGSSWNVRKDFAAHSSQVTGLCIFHCSNRVATCAADSLIKIWDLQEKDPTKRVGTLRGHRDVVRCVAVTKNDAYLLSCADDNIIALWNTERSLLVRTLVNPDGPVAAILVSLAPDDTTLLSLGGAADPCVKLWNLHTGHIVCTLRDHCTCALLVEVADELRLISCNNSDNKCNIWRIDYSSPELIRNASEMDNKVVCTTISRDGKLALTGTDDGNLSTWNAETGQLQSTLVAGQCPVSVVRLSHDNYIVVVGFQNAELGVWDVVSLGRKWTSREHLGAIQSVYITEDCRRIVSGARDKQVILWDTSEGAKLHTFVLDNFGAVSVSMSGESIMACTAENVLYSWNVGGDGTVNKVVGPRVDTPPGPVLVLPDQCKVVSGDPDSSDYVIVDQVGQECRYYSGHGARVSALAVTQDGRFLIAGSVAGTLTVCDLSGQVEPQYCISPHDVSSDPGLGVEISAIVHVTTATDQMTFLTGDVDGAVKLWEPGGAGATRNPADRFQLLGAQHDGVSCFCRPADSMVVSGCRGGTVAVWDLRERHRVTCWEGHHEAVTSIDYTTKSDDDITVITASLDGTIKSWGFTDHETPSPLRVWTLPPTVPAPRYLAAFMSGNHAYFISGSDDGKLRVYTVEDGENPAREIATEQGSLDGLGVTSDGLTAMCSHVEGAYTCWKLSAGEKIFTRQLSKPYRTKRTSSANKSIVCTRPVPFVISAEDEKLIIWDAKNGSIKQVIGTPSSLNCKFSGDRYTDHCVIGNSKSYEVNGRFVVPQPTAQGQRPRVTSVTSTDNGELVASADESNTVHIWSVHPGNELLHLCSFTFEHEINDFSFSDSGRMCVLRQDGTGLCFLDLRKPQD